MIPLNEKLNLLKPSAIRRFSAMAKAVPDCCMLTLGEPDADTPEEIKAAAAAALAQNLTHYAPNQGTLELRQAIADYETARGMETTPEQVIVTVGATEALSVSLQGVLNPGDEVVIFTPAYPVYESLATVAGAKCVFVDIAATGFQIDRDTLTSAITEKTRAIVLNNPNNPTGTVLNARSLEILKDAIAGKSIWLICDQVYDQLRYGSSPDITLDAALAEQRILCQSFSKPYAMTGWRIGYLIAPEDVTAKLLLLHAAQVSCMPTFLQSACVTALKTDTAPMREIYRQRRDYVLRRLDGMGIPYPMPEGAFYVFADVRKFGIGAEEFCTRMIREAAVAAVPGTCFGAEGFVRLSYCCSMEILEKAMDRMEHFVAAL